MFSDRSYSFKEIRTMEKVLNVFAAAVLILLTLAAAFVVFFRTPPKTPDFEVRYDFVAYNEAGTEIMSGSGSCSAKEQRVYYSKSLGIVLANVRKKVNDDLEKRGLSFDPEKTEVTITAIATTSNTSNTPRP